MDRDRFDEISRLAKGFVETEGAKAVFESWRDGMLEQVRKVPSNRMHWESLDPIDKELDETIAFDVINKFLDFIVRNQ